MTSSIKPPSAANDPVPDRGGTLIALTWSLTFVALVAFSARVWIQLRGRSVRWDDAFMTLAMLCFVGWSVVLTIYCLDGGERHLADFMRTEKQHLEEVLFLKWLSQAFSTMGVAFGKVSISALLLLVLRNTHLRWHKLYLWTITITLVVLIGLSFTILVFLQCSPPQALWNLKVKGKCLSLAVVGNYGTFVGAFNTFADLSLVLVPISIFWTLSTNFSEKTQLIIVFSLNILTSVSSALKTYYLNTVNHRDITWDTFNIYLFITLELFFMIVCGTIPTLQPIKAMKKISNAMHNRSRPAGVSNRQPDAEEGSHGKISKNTSSSEYSQREHCGYRINDNGRGMLSSRGME